MKFSCLKCRRFFRGSQEEIDSHVTKCQMKKIIPPERYIGQSRFEREHNHRDWIAYQESRLGCGNEHSLEEYIYGEGLYI